ncbi:hypothetical protein QZH41_004633 [Actinostola sp. cb2023]|nr:hypothetical protein QZH41_004633 [Actinostola sp. cb2023]
MAGVHSPNNTNIKVWTISLHEEIALGNNFPLTGQALRTSTLIAGILSTAMAPFTAFANAIIIAAIWKDPYKQLRSSPSNIIIASMACCDFMVGLVCSSVQSYVLIDGWIKGRRMSSTSVLVGFTGGIFFIGVSLVHVVVLAIDRVIAVINPLLYRSRVTKNRLSKTVGVIWMFYGIYALLQIPLRRYFYAYSITTAILVLLAI